MLWYSESKGFLQETDRYPLSYYMSSDVDEEIRHKYNVCDFDANTPYDRQKVCWINNVSSFPVDDDSNYTVSALRVAERFGRTMKLIF